MDNALHIPLSAIEAELRRRNVRLPFKAKVSLVEVFERLKNLKADKWQIDFCNRLQSATENAHIQGIRTLIHAQPQLGKSVILAQAFPAWLLGNNPIHRFALATYNITRSHKHAKVTIRMMQSAEYQAMFPKDSHIPNVCSPDNFFTFARLQLNDGQVSFNPMGLQSGFVGTGADTLVIDDPYKSAEEAMSETIRENIEVFWDETANARLTEYANVFGMFHRYHEADLAGYLLEGGEFDYWRYASEADGEYKDANGKTYQDPLNRKDGEYITQRFTPEFYEKQKQNSRVWFSQFQGRPISEAGLFFDVSKIGFVDAIPADAKLARGWDKAATENAGDYTAGVKMAKCNDGTFIVCDVVHGQYGTANRDRIIRQTAELDGIKVKQYGEQEPGSAGVSDANAFIRLLAGYPVEVERATGSKQVRADAFSSQVNAGNVKVLRGDWNKKYIDELRAFPNGKNDDEVDGSSLVFNKLNVDFNVNEGLKQMFGGFNI